MNLWLISHEYPIEQILKMIKLQRHPPHFANSKHEDIQLAPPLSICMTLLSTLIFPSFFIFEYILSFYIYYFNFLLNSWSTVKQNFLIARNTPDWLTAGHVTFSRRQSMGAYCSVHPLIILTCPFPLNISFFFFSFFLLNFYLFFCMRCFDFAILLINYQSKSHI